MIRVLRAKLALVDLILFGEKHKRETSWVCGVVIVAIVAYCAIRMALR